ncbi:septation protein SepH [Antiquaquibacter soli]|uniref:Septation protein SepH n=1 Tax=Antiquaquibacter soli TaxID=3064523 RepID=A0ABT9BM44_9MICO|nr:septation protein SepH [Protaetiibacter sp. WY-16]MDO7882080.1 septation protein SepH [Protaetiibacter sp. WY-16]
MQELRVVGTEGGALIVASEDGVRYRIPAEDVVQAGLRQAPIDHGASRRIAPKDIQAHIRSGMSAQDVASITGAPLEYIQRFEGPVLAEREFVVNSALDVPVRTASDTDPMAQGTTFGVAIRQRLADVSGTNERWASWKETGGGWIVKLSFTANQIDHDARWQFDPRKQSLVPLNNEAVTLSQQGEAAGSLIPRLRAVGPTEPVEVDAPRFDSGAFLVDDSPADEPPAPAPPAPVALPRSRAEEEPVQGNQTADLLEALRRRRGERESAGFGDEDARAAHPSTGGIRVVDVPIDSVIEDESNGQRSTAPQPTTRKKGRAAMPTWDEIVFGARPDDDPA